ncbi:hypothetical protein [Acidithiobacillus sp. AMEEHan]|uniref:hypothetical protein n=1 Tax=Acidithiobacillus sp. AMEEHan TaxID=2994951 RepID=UPI0027E59A48|nr:hypothetical protein [Acidithiobacillus sp. AMEEHan]
MEAGRHMLVSSDLLEAWGTGEFYPRLTKELLAGDLLFAALQQALTQGSVALLDDLHFLELRRWEDADAFTLQLQVLYRSAIPGCACPGDPDPENELQETARLLIRIDRRQQLLELQLLESE